MFAWKKDEVKTRHRLPVLGKQDDLCQRWAKTLSFGEDILTMRSNEQLLLQKGKGLRNNCDHFSCSMANV